MNVALAGATCDAVRDAQDAAVIVITGADPAFCAGLDLRSLGTDDMGGPPAVQRRWSRTRRCPRSRRSTGPRSPAGSSSRSGCDFIVASERAAFADTHLRVGVYPGPVLVDLPRRVGMAWARELSLTGNFVDAETAGRIGIANHVVPHDELLPFARALARAIAEQDRGMVAAMRRDWDATGSLPIADAHRVHLEHGRDAGSRSAPVPTSRPTATPSSSAPAPNAPPDPAPVLASKFHA